MSEVCTIIKLFRFCPATNAVSERCTSGLCRVKSYLRSTMTQQWLNHLITLYMHNDKTDELNLIFCLIEFVEGGEYRNRIFCKF